MRAPECCQSLMPVLSLGVASTEAGRLILVDLDKSDTIWRQVIGISYLKGGDLLGFRQLMAI
jgi:hypothetical protein